MKAVLAWTINYYRQQLILQTVIPFINKKQTKKPVASKIVYEHNSLCSFLVILTEPTYKYMLFQ